MVSLRPVTELLDLIELYHFKYWDAGKQYLYRPLEGGDYYLVYERQNMITQPTQKVFYKVMPKVLTLEEMLKLRHKITVEVTHDKE